MSNICRLCLQISQSTDFLNVFQNTGQYPDFPTLADLLYWVFGVSIDVDDSYSKLICKECINIIQYVQAFRNLFAANQQILAGQNISEKYRLSKEQHQILTKTPHYTKTACIPFLELVKLGDDNYLEDSNNRYMDNRNISNLSNTGKSTTENETEVCSHSILLPSIEIPRLETFVHRKYKKIDHFTYKKNSVSNEQKCSKRKQKFIEYYYRKSTTALQELIAARKTKTTTEKGITSRSPISLLEVKNVIDIQMCKICDQVFERKTLLDMHREIMHKDSLKHGKNIKRNWKIWKTARNKKFSEKLSKTNSISPYRSTNHRQLNNFSNSCAINEKKMDLTKSRPNITNEMRKNTVFNHNFPLKKVNEILEVCINEEKFINSVFVNDDNEFAKVNQNIESLPACNNTIKSEVIDDSERIMDNHYSDHNLNSISDKRKLKTNITSKNIQVKKKEFCNIPNTTSKQNNAIFNSRLDNPTKRPAENRKVINTDITNFLQEKRDVIERTRTEIRIMKILQTALYKNITDSV